MLEQDFCGFPDRAEVTPVPNLFFSAILPKLEDIVELKAILYVFWLLSRRRGNNRFVSYSELAASSGLAENQLKQALRHATEHKVLLSLKVETDKRSEEIFFINDSGGRKALESIQQGGVGGLHPVLHHDDVGGKAEIANIFRLYEENIGLLTPMIAEELREAERLYPWDWIESAFREAVTLNKRNWKYISRILERWATEGKDDGKTGRYSAKRADREKYVRGKYGHLVKR